MYVRLPYRCEEIRSADPTDLTRVMCGDTNTVRVSDNWDCGGISYAINSMICLVLTSEVIERIVPAWNENGQIILVYRTNMNLKFETQFRGLTPATWDDVTRKYGNTVPFGMFPQTVLDDPAVIKILSYRQMLKLTLNVDNSKYHSGIQYALARYGYIDTNIDMNHMPDALHVYCHDEYPLDNNFYVSYLAPPWVWGRMKVTLSNGWPVTEDYMEKFLNEVFWKQILQHQQKMMRCF